MFPAPKWQPITPLHRLLVWQRAASIPGCSAAVYRADRFGGVMQWSEYGNSAHDYGWELDRRVSLAEHGNEIANLEPLNWRNQRAKADGLL